jgi:hypothetical protein
MIDGEDEGMKTVGTRAALGRGRFLSCLLLGSALVAAGIWAAGIWAVGSAVGGSATGTVSVTIAAPAVVTTQATPVVTVGTTGVAANNFDFGSSGSPPPPPSIPQSSGNATSTSASVGIFGAPNQAVSIGLPDSAVMTVGSQVVEVSGLTHSGGANPTLGGAGASTFGIDLNQVSVATAADLGFAPQSGGDDGPGSAALADAPEFAAPPAPAIEGLAEAAATFTEFETEAGLVEDGLIEDPESLAAEVETFGSEALVEAVPAEGVFADPAADGLIGEALAEGDPASGAEAGTGPSAVAGAPLPVNRTDPFGMVTNVGPYFYVMISYY